MSACISAEEYVIWVKGSLNRWLGAGLSENGGTAPPYRGWVKEFQTLCDTCTRNGDVDEMTQNAMIKANHQHDRYVSWVQQTLNQGLQGAAVASDGVMTPQTISAIKKFQTANQLEPNGWVGAKTETVLRKKGGQKPPATPPKVMPLIFQPKWGARTAKQLALFWSDQFLLEPLSEPLGDWNPVMSLAQRVYLQKFLKALWQIDADTEYVPGDTVGGFINAGKREPAFGGIENDKLPEAFHSKWVRDALEKLIQDTGIIMAAKYWSYAEGYQKFKHQLLKLYKSIYDSLAHICFEVKACDFSNPELNNQATMYIGGWLFVKQKPGSNSILRIFPKHLHVGEVSE